MITPACDGPLIWYPVFGDPEPDPDNPGTVVVEVAGILCCARPTCDYVVVTGGWNDEAHAFTPVLREGLA